MSISSKFSFSAHALKILKFVLHDSILKNFFQLIYKPLLHIYKIVDVAAILVSGFSVLKHFCSEIGKKRGSSTKWRVRPLGGQALFFCLWMRPSFFPLSEQKCFNTEKRLTKVACMMYTSLCLSNIQKVWFIFVNN